jgi:Mg-chelatase subunit ChlD
MPEKSRITVVPVAPTFNQLGLFILDGSGSMAQQATGNISKAQAVNQAVRDVFTRFRRSRSRRNFSFAVITFDEAAQLHTGVTAAEEVADDADYNPLANHGGGTDIGAGLLEAKRVADDFLQQAPADPPASVVLVVMSDGRDGEAGGDPASTLRIAEDIKKNKKIKICTSYFAGLNGQDTVAEAHLKALASHSATDFQTVHDAQALRDFFLASTSMGMEGLT